MGESRGFVQISIEEYDSLIENKKTLDSILNSDKCIEVSSLFSYDVGGAVYLCNPTAEVKNVIDRLIEEKNIIAKRYFDWANKDKCKKVRLWHIGKTIKQVIDDK